MSKATLWLAGATLVLCSAGPASAQNFLFNSAETIDQGNFKLGAYPVLLLADKGVTNGDNNFGLHARAGYGFTPSFDVEAKFATFDGFKMYGADAEYWLLKGRWNASVSGGYHWVSSDVGADSGAFDIAGIASTRVADNLDFYGGLSVSFESLKDIPNSDFRRVYLVPGLEYKLHRNVDLVAEFGVGLNDNSPNYFGGGVSFYLR